jgi:hypothetical protein
VSLRSRRPASLKSLTRARAEIAFTKVRANLGPYYRVAGRPRSISSYDAHSSRRLGALAVQGAHLKKDRWRGYRRGRAGPGFVVSLGGAHLVRKELKRRRSSAVSWSNLGFSERTGASTRLRGVDKAYGAP